MKERGIWREREVRDCTVCREGKGKKVEVKALTTEWGRVGGDKERVRECNDYIERKKRHHRHDVAAAKAIKLKEEMRESAASKKK